MPSGPISTFLAGVLLTLLLQANPALGQDARMRLLVQSSPLAGSQFHALKSLVHRMQEGDALTLVREPDNPHDPLAIRVEWQGHKLGYVPRKENRAVAEAMDRGEHLQARVSRIRDARNPWQRLELEILMEL